MQGRHPTFSRAAGRNCPSQDYGRVLKCFTVGLKYPSASLVGVIKQTMRRSPREKDAACTPPTESHLILHAAVKKRSRLLCTCVSLCPPPPQRSAAGHVPSRHGRAAGSFAGASSLNRYAFAGGVCLFLFNFSRRLHTDTIKSKLIQYLWPLLLHYSLSRFYVLLHFPHRH